VHFVQGAPSFETVRGKQQIQPPCDWN